MALAVLLALGSALAYGVSDFFGGMAASRLRVIPTTILSYAAATVVVLGLVLATGGVWSSDVWLWGSVAGVAAVIGFVAFYAAMAVGPMSLVSPVIAVLGSAVPVGAAVALGETLTAWAWVGVLLALGSAVLLSSRPRAGAARLTTRAVVLSVVAGVSLGASVVALDRTPAESGSLAALVELGLGLVLLLLTVLLGRAIRPLGRRLDTLGGEAITPSRRSRMVIVALAAGALLGVASAAILAALQAGSLAIVSVLVGLYPLATLLLARIVGGERMTRLQLTGAALAVAASALLGLALGG